jgi:putative addiction module component (TIGR02574 family)
MTQAVAQILAEIERLSPPDRADLADCIVETLIDGIPPEIEQAQFEEVRRRMAEVESGEVKLIPGEQALEQVRRLVASARMPNR